MGFHNGSVARFGGSDKWSTPSADLRSGAQPERKARTAGFGLAAESAGTRKRGFPRRISDEKPPQIRHQSPYGNARSRSTFAAYLFTARNRSATEVSGGGSCRWVYPLRIPSLGHVHLSMAVVALPMGVAVFGFATACVRRTFGRCHEGICSYIQSPRI